MHTVNALSNPAPTFLTHLFGQGLADERYVVERFQALADGDIRRWPAGKPGAKRHRNAKPRTASLRTVKRLRPARNEIIVCTGLRTRSGVQYWGEFSLGKIVLPREPFRMHGTRSSTR